MSSNLTQTDIANLALLKLGSTPIQSIGDQSNPAARACLVAWPQSLAEVSRETAWNCLKKLASLAQLAIPANGDCAGNVPPGTNPWAPGVNYAVNSFVTFGQPAYLYQCLIANLSGASFTVDLTKGYWFQTTIFSPNYLGPFAGNTGPGSEWKFAYQLPTDFILLIELNGQNCWRGDNSGNGNLYEIFQGVLYCNAAFANIKYVRYETNTTLFDSLFTGALILHLAASIATTVRKDDADLAEKMMAAYQMALTEARQKNAGESQPRRYSIASQSRFIRSRYRSTNG